MHYAGRWSEAPYTAFPDMKETEMTLFLLAAASEKPLFQVKHTCRNGVFKL